MPPKSASASAARRLANFILCLDGFVVRERMGAGYNHMGAIICDTILQAGLNYKTVVAPRVQNVLHRWPSAWRTTGFTKMMKRNGVHEILHWRDDEKPNRIRALTGLLISHGVDTESDLRSWLTDESNVALLRTLRGVGPKSADYIKSLVGVPAVAVDRHVRTFVGWAGIVTNEYYQIRETVCKAAELLGYGHCELDHAIWSYVSTNEQSRRLQTVA